MTSVRWTVGGCMLLFFAAGCGSQGSTPVKPARVFPSSLPSSPQMLLPTPAAGSSDPQQLLAELRQAYAQVPGFAATVETQETGKGKTEKQVVKTLYKRPSTLRINVIVGPDGKPSGNLAIWEGGSKLKVKPSWVPFSLDMDIADDRLLSLNGWTIRDYGVTAIARIIADPALQVRYLGEQTKDGKSLAMLHLTSSQSPKGATHEVIGVDRASKMPLLRMIHKGNTLAYQTWIKELKQGAPTADQLKI